MVSGIRAVKNISYAMAAFDKIENDFPQIKLLLVGPVIDNKEAIKIKTTGEKLSGFSYLGEKPPPEVRVLMSASDVLLNTSLNEGMSGSILEAMAEGLPILATRVPGNTSLVMESENGFLVALDSEEELIRSAIELATDRQKRNRFGNAGRQMVIRYHSVKQEIERYVKIYNTILKSL